MFRNDYRMNEITRTEAEELGVDLSMLSVCKKLRKLAKLDRLRLDEGQHRSGLNTHLLDYIKYCGETPLEFVKQYLSNLQPYMLERRKDQEKRDSFICIMDNVYRVSLYIKVDKTFGEEVVVSFHENNVRGIAKTNSLIKNTKEHLVAVFVDSYTSINLENGNTIFKVFVQRGMKVLPLAVSGVVCQDVVIVRQEDIERQFVDYCNQYLRDLYTSDLDLDFDSIEIFSMLQQISFTSYGRDTFSSISLLIDSLVTQKDFISKQAADFALITFIQSLQLTNEQKLELSDLLEEKYKVSDIKAIDSILYRVNSILCKSMIESGELEIVSSFN